MINVAAKAFRLDKAILYRTLPFALFMAFIAIEEGLRFASARNCLPASNLITYYLYPLKAFTVALLLYLYRDKYRELNLKDLRKWGTSAVVLLVGVATFIMWIQVDWTIPVSGAPKGFNPMLLPEGHLRTILTATRVAGAVLVVPLMEELFWRSFLLRYLVDADFESVQLGRFTWGSFIITTILFGLEHHLIAAGMIAGAIYSVILYRTRSLAQCVLAHAVTNLALSCYVLYTEKWYFW